MYKEKLNGLVYQSMENLNELVKEALRACVNNDGLLYPSFFNNVSNSDREKVINRLSKYGKVFNTDKRGSEPIFMIDSNVKEYVQKESWENL